MAKAVKVALGKRQINKIDKFVEHYQSLDEQIKALTAERDAIKKQISECVEATGEEKVDTGRFVVHAHEFEKVSVDTDALKKAGIYEQYLKSATSYYFRIFASK